MPPVQRAAALAEALIQNHGFVDGNKRTAMYAVGLRLEREGRRLEATQDELVDFALALVEHTGWKSWRRQAGRSSIPS